MIRLGLIGVGNVGSAHAESIEEIENAELIAAADPNEKRMQPILNKHPKCVALKESQELLQREDVDAVIVASPTPLHYSHAKEALNQGKPVYLESPMARTAEEVDELVQLAKEKQRIVTVGQTQRRFPEMESLKAQVEAGAVGKPGMIRLGRRTPHPQSWFADHEQSGGVVLDAMIHELDFLLWSFGPIQRVYCQTLNQQKSSENKDYALASLRLKSGTIAHVESSWCHYGQFAIDAEIAGDEGMIHFDNQESIPLKISIVESASGKRQYSNESPVLYPAHFRLLEEFIKAVEGNGENPVPIEEGAHAVKAALALLESARTKKPIILG